MGVVGKQSMAFRLLGSDKDWEWDVEVVTNGTPNILGIDFWDSVQATMDLPNRCIWALHPSGSWERLPFSATDRSSNAAAAAAVSVESDNEVVAALEEICTTKQPQSLMFRGTPFWKRPFEQKQPQPVVAPRAADKQRPSTRAVVRAPKTMMLEPQQPVIVQLPIAASRYQRCQQWSWEPATLEVSNDCSTGKDEEDFSSIKLSAQSVTAAHKPDTSDTPVLTQVLMNPTSERLWVPEGTILGWVEEAPEIFSLQEVLQQQLANHAAEVGDEQAAEIHAVLDAAGKARSELRASIRSARSPPDARQVR